MSDSDRSIQEQCDLLMRGVEEVVPEGSLPEVLQRARDEDRPLRIKLGLDPTSSDIHLGFAVVLRKLRQFQDLGHIACLVIGDFTASIGDPSERSKTRPLLTREQIEEHVRTYEAQLYRILDPDRTELLYNGDWLGPMSFGDVVKLSSQYTVARLLERDDFANRYATGQPIGLHEFLYPLCQGHDSVAIRADVELGGTDQKFNNLVGRDLQRAAGQPPQAVMLTPLLVGLDGVEKMSKSLGNYIGIDEPPTEQFGKAMSLADDLMEPFFRLATLVPLDEVDAIIAAVSSGDMHPMDAKFRLAREIVTEYYDAEAAEHAEAEFKRVFRSHDAPDDMPDVAVGGDAIEDGTLRITELVNLAAFATSNRESRQLVEQGAVSIDGERVADPNARVTPREGAVLKVGKRRFARIRLG
ncbi:tyrosine--tRNA ligase [Candidatus Poribacteria bacterium]|jgi:tyrosyl-tRNA synthetase|nr:tyrosine--tRNA ligase [Candidatus Poribacteria bacterium]MBT5533326.1 tyrosine--tRNA ligase [Candidatus Poribacteria bacterium]MBT5709556.1 tyrosine--tRNA ligase [Candidatus Poribacteria bacterium]MBT7098508.1 tyrosine--tRNA ligase [Candidatus Poribacteria bacterium]MBT7804391.1 tyrosine--tRNA ligase [Candidatus Poribacteria bacterium]